MPVTVEVYQCNYCDKTLKTERGIINHEKTCSKNPIYNLKIKRRDDMADAIEKIRQTATSPEHLIQLIEEHLLKHGLKINFDSYPANFSLDVGNSHNSPKGYPHNWCGHGDEKGIPKGYPGWSGSWKGSIEIIDRDILGIEKKDVSLSDIRGDWGDGLMRMWFINTGSGGGGKNFRYSGMIWVYDFPKMKAEFEQNGDNFRTMDKDYTKMVLNYENQFCTKRGDFIDEDDSIQKLEKMQKDLDELRSKVYKKEQERKGVLTNEFNKKYGKPLPLPSTAFLDDNEKIMKAHTNISYKANVVHEDLKDLFGAVSAKMEEINNYINTNPEMFI